MGFPKDMKTNVHKKKKNISWEYAIKGRMSIFTGYSSQKLLKEIVEVERDFFIVV